MHLRRDGQSNWLDLKAHLLYAHSNVNATPIFLSKLRPRTGHNPCSNCRARTLFVYSLNFSSHRVIKLNAQINNGCVTTNNIRQYTLFFPGPRNWVKTTIPRYESLDLPNDSSPQSTILFKESSGYVAFRLIFYCLVYFLASNVRIVVIIFPFRYYEVLLFY